VGHPGDLGFDRIHHLLKEITMDAIWIVLALVAIGGILYFVFGNDDDDLDE
jgi:hypothetical protein